jgi:Saxitoxin biosynthesis operon protein SxtJ
MESNNNKTDTSKATILVICMGFILIYLSFHVKWALLVSLGVGIVSIASTFISQKIEWGWMKLSKVLGYIVPNILLSLVFFIFLFPMALIARLFNKDPLMMKNKYKTYFIDINKQMEKKSFENIW